MVASIRQTVEEEYMHHMIVNKHAKTTRPTTTYIIKVPTNT